MENEKEQFGTCSWCNKKETIITCADCGCGVEYGKTFARKDKLRVCGDCHNKEVNYERVD